MSIVLGFGSRSDAGCCDANDTIAVPDTTTVDRMTAWDWHRAIEESRIQQLHLELSRRHRPHSLALVNVRLISMVDERIREDYTVLVRNGVIERVGPANSISVPTEYLRIDGRGQYLLPGLVDMHTHNLTSSSQHLLNVAKGVTTVRDMCGFEWILELREKIARSEILAPNMYVAGHIINAYPMDMYATVVKDPDSARKVVCAHAAAGYDFIKIHNRLAIETYDAVLDEAKRIGIDVVGHIPHEIRVSQAIQAGQRTLEHFKGYLQDWNLQLTPDDYVSATKGAEVWNCPTFYAGRAVIRGPAAESILRNSRQMRYVSQRDRYQWTDVAKEEPVALQIDALELKEKVFRDLMAIDARFLAGTDSGGGYPFMVYGFALHDELRTMQRLGLSPYETLKTTTTNPAEAMRRADEFGTVAPGKRADLILVSANPLDTVSNLEQLEGVVIRGVWLARSDLDEILDRLESILSAHTDLPPTNPRSDAIDNLWKSITELHDQDYILRSHDLEELANEFENREMPQRAKTLRSMLVKESSSDDKKNYNGLSPAEIQAWRSDLRTMHRELEKRHFNLYHTVDVETFANAVERLHERIPTLERHQVPFEFQRLVSQVGDLHTSVRLSRDRSIPVEFGIFSDGVFVTAAAPNHAALLGARVTGVGGATIKEAMARVGQLASADNDMTVKFIVPYYLRVPEALHTLGIINDINQIPIHLNKEGRAWTAHVPAGTGSDEDSERIQVFESAPGILPLYLRDSKNAYWFEYDEPSKMLYVQFNAVFDKEGDESETIVQFFERLIKFGLETEINVFVLDLRLNGGGNDPLFRPVLSRLLYFLESKGLNQKGKFFTVIGRATCSAAQHIVNDLEYLTDTIFVGEPTSQRVHFFSDSRWFTLPKTGTRVRASIGFLQNYLPNHFEKRDRTTPHILAELSFEDFVNKRDPVMSAIRQYQLAQQAESTGD